MVWGAVNNILQKLRCLLFQLRTLFSCILYACFAAHIIAKSFFLVSQRKKLHSGWIAAERSLQLLKRRLTNPLLQLILCGNPPL